MGVPAFYRWLSEKFPKIVVRAVEEVPEHPDAGVDATAPNPNGFEFDNLYLDMNGIIHPCTHPEDGKAPSSEEEMFEKIGAYIVRIFNIVRPRKLLYMAIDGIAPRAKMNQQRSRRYRAAQEVDEARADEERVRKAMLAKGLAVPERRSRGGEGGGEFDSNTITPGTLFMDRLAKYLRFFIVSQQNLDPAWAQCKIILSDAQSPGEGEHKIMQFIRRQRAEPGHDPNTMHCMYGLDADLIMLGLASHEIRFTILREEVVFGPKNRNTGVKLDPVLQPSANNLNNNDDGGFLAPTPALAVRKPYDLVKLWILREYLAFDFRPEAFAGGGLPFAYDFERCVDDFIFLCFFVGNDFLPHLPSLSIREGGLDLLLNVYRRTLPMCGGYLTQDGDVDLSRVDVILSVLGEIEDEIFKRRKEYEDRERERKERRARSVGMDPNKITTMAAKKRLKEAIENAPIAYNSTTVVSVSSLTGSTLSSAPPPKPPPPPSAAANKSAAAALRASLMGVPPLASSSSSAASKEESVPTTSVAAMTLAQESATTTTTKLEVTTAEATTTTTATAAAAEEEEEEEDEVVVLDEDVDEPVVIDKSLLLPHHLHQSTSAGEAPSSSPTNAEGSSSSSSSRKRKSEDDVEETPSDDLKAKKDGNSSATTTTATNEDKGKTENENEDEDEMMENKTFEERLKILEQKRMVKEDVTDEIRYGEEGFKERYYVSKFGEVNGRSPEFKRRMVESYVRGLCWVLQYYYKGCQSWKWYYAYHYAPFASDLRNTDEVDVTWAPSQPFRPFEQLMAVLPPQSAHALPAPCRWYMTSEDSPIIDFYPKTINFDANGKPVKWLWVALLSFIDESRLLNVSKEIAPKLTEDEVRRNEFRPDLLYVTSKSLGFEEILRIYQLAKSMPPSQWPALSTDAAMTAAKAAKAKTRREEEEKKKRAKLTASNGDGDKEETKKEEEDDEEEEVLHLPAPTTSGDVFGGGNDVLFSNASKMGGVSGYILPAPPEFEITPGAQVESPYPSILRSIDSSSSYCMEIRLAPMKPHLSRLCPGVTIPAQTLTAADFNLKRRQQGLDVSNLLDEMRPVNGGQYGGNNGYGNNGMMMMMGNPYGAPPPPYQYQYGANAAMTIPPPPFAAPLPPPYQQYQQPQYPPQFPGANPAWQPPPMLTAQVGERSWGSAEPQVYHKNPFLIQQHLQQQQQQLSYAQYPYAPPPAPPVAASSTLMNFQGHMQQQPQMQYPPPLQQPPQQVYYGDVANNNNAPRPPLPPGLLAQNPGLMQQLMVSFQQYQQQSQYAAQYAYNPNSGYPPQQQQQPPHPQGPPPPYGYQRR